MYYLSDIDSGYTEDSLNAAVEHLSGRLSTGSLGDCVCDVRRVMLAWAASGFTSGGDLSVILGYVARAFQLYYGESRVYVVQRRISSERSVLCVGTYTICLTRRFVYSLKR